MKRLASAAAMAVAASSLVLAAAPANASSFTTRKACTEGGGHVVQTHFAGGYIHSCSGGTERNKIVRD